MSLELFDDLLQLVKENLSSINTLLCVYHAYVCMYLDPLRPALCVPCLCMYVSRPDETSSVCSMPMYLRESNVDCTVRSTSLGPTQKPGTFKVETIQPIVCLCSLG
ncbi:hypothetical protein RRG08_031458 [Elysia crispata]|uniref:Uncharacterized protein n=1 Tax=Elysia crispata TaxID=231223 RepID=A0AAE1DK77_9GAST|nr:hypothetical protein RRG08_031458 [Elysia crispata]